MKWLNACRDPSHHPQLNLLIYRGVAVGEVVGGDDVVGELAGVDDGGHDESDFEGDVKEGAEEVVGGSVGETIEDVVGVDFGDVNNPKRGVVLGLKIVFLVIILHGNYVE